jgi:hypothetical protein
MPSHPRFVLVFAALLALASGCSYHVFSPPARVFHMESAAPAKPGETIVGARGGFYGGVFEPGAIVGSGIVRHGVAPNVELNGEATYANIQDDDDENTRDVDKNAGSARLGVKAGNQYAAVIGGLGGGVTALGGFGAADVGGIVSYANCYVVPFFSASGFASTPLGEANTASFGNGVTSRPGVAFGYGAGAGLEIPLDRARCRAGVTAPRLQLGANLMSVVGRHYSTDASITTPKPGWDQHGYLGLGLGVEIPLTM